MAEPVELIDETTDIAEHDSGTDETVEDEMLVEEISIDGMCGVY